MYPFARHHAQFAFAGSAGTSAVPGFAPLCRGPLDRDEAMHTSRNAPTARDDDVFRPMDHPDVRALRLPGPEGNRPRHPGACADTLDLRRCHGRRVRPPSGGRRRSGQGAADWAPRLRDGQRDQPGGLAWRSALCCSPGSRTQSQGERRVDGRHGGRRHEGPQSCPPQTGDNIRRPLTGGAMGSRLGPLYNDEVIGGQVWKRQRRTPVLNPHDAGNLVRRSQIPVGIRLRPKSWPNAS